MSGGRGDGRSIKEKTVLVDVGDNRNIKAADVIANVEKEVGEGTVLACVPKSGNSYELTLTDKDALDLIVDTEIREKLLEFGVILKSPIKRKMHPGTDVANGTRYVVVRFPPERQSLPYTLKLSTGVSSFEYIRVVHDEQKRVCTQCFETSHVYANCPDNICYKCKRFGHLARACETPPCETCHKVLSYCRCEPVWNRGENENETTNNDTENDINANNSRNETNSDIPERETNTEQQENDGMKENEAGDEHTDGANGDVDNMEQSDDDDDNTAKSDGEDDDDTMEESNADDDAKDEQFDENAKKDNDVTVSDEKQMSGVDNDELDLMTDDEHSNKQETVNVDNKMHKKGGSSPSKLEPQPVPRGPNLTDTAGKKQK
ncbi:unnamed protein product [Mytilus edulis]|uniref:CCHC-type domain-containing protein n=1 Tax=Mytilus edulis TaxID=6550 RepID=A0A8S3UKF7_MYTED|nr:unnamed protein product [Mytilus edulis]